MSSVYKSAAGERAVRERYLEILKFWPAPNRQMRVPTREGKTFIVVCGPEGARPLVLFHGSVANSAMWMADVAQWSQHFRIFAVDMIGDAGLSAPSRPRFDSEAHALWLDDVLQALSLTSASMAGVSLGGWLALDYAIRRPARLDSLALLCPGGVGRVNIGTLCKLFPLQLLGAWGKRKAAEIVLGSGIAKPSPAAQKFMEFVQLIHNNFRPRRVKLPVFSDHALAGLNMPVLAILGGQDVLIDSEETRRRLERNVPQAEIRYLPEAGHFIPPQTAPILDFLLAVPQSNRSYASSAT
jgi:pimeloyl-ACP methyl ester carboxylesterase